MQKFIKEFAMSLYFQLFKILVLLLSLFSNGTLQLRTTSAVSRKSGTHINANTPKVTENHALDNFHEQKTTEYLDSKRHFPFSYSSVSDGGINKNRFPYEDKKLNMAQKLGPVPKQENFQNVNDNPFSLYKSRLHNEMSDAGHINSFGSERGFYSGVFPLYRRSHRFTLNGFGRNLFHPYRHNKYRNHPSDIEFLRDRKYMEQIPFDNQFYPVNNNVLADPEENAFTENSSVLQEKSHSIKNDLGENANNELFTEKNETSLLSDTRDIVNKSPSNSTKASQGFIPQSELKMTVKDGSSVKHSSYRHGKENELNHFYMPGGGKFESHRILLPTLSRFHQREADKNTTISTLQKQTEHTKKIKPVIENLMFVSNDRIFYEKVPPNLNLSWYVYVNCSRDRCQFSNTTNETDLINEGWVLHNCTSYGCTELYPRRESFQRFIGLMLLVFSLCILKIVGFILVFYYCRHIKMAKSGYDGKRRAPWDDERQDFSNKGYDKINKNVDTDINSKDRKRNPDSSRYNFSDQQHAINISPGNKLERPNVAQCSVDHKLDSKVWIPPIQIVSTSLLSPKKTKDILIPSEFLEKIPKFEDSAMSLRGKRKTRSRIPRLKRLTKNKQSTVVMNKEDSCHGAVNSAVVKAKQGQDLLLMNLDDDSNDLNVLRAPNKLSNWDALFVNE